MRVRLLPLIASLLALAAPLARADRRVGPAPGAAPLVVHEWGVWKVRDGEVAHLADLQRESPPFVHRVVGGPAWVPGGTVARKPVVYVYASQPTQVDVEVSFRGGGPWLHYPAATPIGCAADAALRRDLPFVRAATCSPSGLAFRVLAVPDGRAPLAPVPRGHFWSVLRGVPAATLLAPDGAAERFLFYDGPVAFPAAYRRGVGTHGETTLRKVGAFGQGPLTVAWADRWVPVPAMPVSSGLGIDRSHPWPVPSRPIAAEIERRVREAGLTAAEARSLVDTWRPEIEAPGLRSFWLLSRAEYDALLPIRVSPTPHQLVRVGLVIEDLGP